MAQLDLFRLDDRVALIAGGGGAIGSALGAALAGAGARVALLGPTAERLDRAAKSIRKQGGEAMTVGRRRYLRGGVRSRGGRGRCPIRPPRHRRQRRGWRRGQGAVRRRGLSAMTRGTGSSSSTCARRSCATQAAVKPMIDGGRGGKVLNITSVRGTLGINAGYSAYVAAKGAINSLTRQWATEWAKHGINVNAISPTFVDTPQVASMLADEKFKAGHHQSDPDGTRWDDRRPGRCGDLPVLRRVELHHRPDPRHRRRPDGDSMRPT